MINLDMHVCVKIEKYAQKIMKRIVDKLSSFRKVPSLFKKDPKQLQKLLDVLREASLWCRTCMACELVVTPEHRGLRVERWC